MSIPTYQISAFMPTPDNKRRIDESSPKFLELVESIRKFGVLEPILARPLGSGYEIRAGERRWRASKAAGLTEIPAIIREMTDHEAVEITCIENLHREDLTPLEEADLLQLMLDNGWTMDQAANQIGRSASWVARRAQLTQLSAAWRNGVGEESDRLPSWSASHYEVIAALPAELQEQLAQELRRCAHLNGFSVKDLKEMVARYTRCLSAAKWKLDDGTMPCGACVGCQKRTDAQPLLFDDQPAEESSEKKLSKHVQCLDAQCWAGKEQELVRRKSEELREKHETVLYLGDAKNGLGVKTVQAEWEFPKVKKGTEGAIPALRVSSGYSGNAGEVIWVKPREGSKAAAQAENGGVLHGKSLAEKRAGLEKARVKIVAVKAAEFIAVAQDVEFDEDEILRLAYTWGTAHQLKTNYHYAGGTSEGIELRSRRVKTQPRGQLVQMLFYAVRPVASDFARHIANQDKPEVDALKLCCSLWKLSWDALWAEACEERKEPAAWAKQEQAERKNIPAEVDAAHEALATPAKPKRGRKAKAVAV